MMHLHRFILAAISAAFFVGSAQAQNGGTVTQHAFAIGKGAGVAGYSSLLCTSAQLAVGQSAADPICHPLSGDATMDATGAVTLANGATTRSHLGLAIGTNVEAWDTDLDCLAAISTTGVIKRTGGGTCSAGTVALSDLATGTQDTVIGYFGSAAASALAINNCANALTYSTTTHTFGCNVSAGTGTITSVTPGSGLVSSTTAPCSQTAITASGTLSAARCFDARTTTTETINDSDRAKILTFNNASPVAASIAQAGAASNFQAGWFVDIRNLGAGTVTITPTTSTINGQSSFKLIQGASGRLASDGTNYQFLVSTSPSALQASPANPATTTSTSSVMAGLGSTCTITPVVTGRIRFEIKGVTSTSGSGTVGSAYKASFGTGTAPSNGAAFTGTQVGQEIPLASVAGNANVQWVVGGVVTGLTLGTGVWLDTGYRANGGATTVTAANISCNAFEF